MAFKGRTVAAILGSLAIGGMVASAEAAFSVDLRVISVTGANASYTTKTATLNEGDTVTVGLYLTDLPNANGLGSFSFSVRSFGETYNVPGSPTAIAVPTTADTVVNATGLAANAGGLGAGFDTGVGGALLDINALSGNPDPNDTDVDARAITASQATGGTPNTIGVGVSSTVLLGTATFTALDLNDLTRQFNRTVNLNTFFTTSAAPNGGLNIRALNSSDPGTSAPSTTNLATAGIIGSNVVVTVVPPVLIPVPAALPLGLAGLGLAAWAARRRYVG